MTINVTKILGSAIATFALTAALVRATIPICTARGWVAWPRRDRWHQGLPCLFGGVPLWAGFVIVCAVTVRNRAIWSLIALSSLMFALGLADDIVGLRPRMKLLVQLACAALLVATGVVYPISTSIMVCVGFSVLWVVGITNAFNLLDNMDGLASGVALIATGYTAIFYYLQDETQYALALAIFAGALAAFMVFNFNPARIFLGDTGSLTIGFFLGSATLLRVVHIANVTALLLAPVLLLAVPLFDTFFVSVTRRLRGQPVSQGGTDHSSHRFVKLGLNERSAVLFLYFMCGVSGAVALIVRTLRTHDAIAVVLVWFFMLFVFGIHLFQPQPEDAMKANGAPAIVRRFNRRDILAWVLDPVALALAYYLAYTIRFRALDRDWVLFYESIAVILTCKFAALYLTGTYRRSWWRGSLFDVWGIARAIGLGEMISIALLTGVSRFQGYSRTVFLLDGFLSWGLLLATRSSPKAFQRAVLVAQSQKLGRSVFLVGTSERAELALHFLRMSGLHCAGLIDSLGGTDVGRKVWGVQVVGRIDDIAIVTSKYEVSEIVVPQRELAAQDCAALEQICHSLKISLSVVGLQTVKPVHRDELVIQTALLDGGSDVGNWAVNTGGTA